MMCGLSLSGKTYFVNELMKSFKNRLYVLDSRSIHDYLNRSDLFQDDNSIDGKAFQLRQDTTDAIQSSIISILTKNNISIILDSCNRKREERGEKLKLVKRLNSNIQTILIFVNPKHDIVLKRAKTEDDSLIKGGKVPVWKDLIEKQIATFDKPSKDEVDFMFEFTGENLTEIIKDLGNHINT